MSQAARLTLALLMLAHADAATADGARTLQGGLLHPLLVPSHAFAVLALGLLIGRQAGVRFWLAPACYAAGLGIGFTLLAAAFMPTLAIEALLTATVVSGASVALVRPVPEPFRCLLGFVTGAALALDSSPGGISVRDANAVLAGTFSSAVILLIAVAKLTGAAGRPWQKTGARILGSWIAASAILVLALRLTG